MPTPARPLLPGAMLLSSWKTLPKPAAETLCAEERNVLTARLAALLDENNQLLRELAAARTERDALQRALNALERKSKRELFDSIPWPSQRKAETDRGRAVLTLIPCTLPRGSDRQARTQKSPPRAELSVFSTSAYLGLALFMQSLMKDLRSLPVRFFLSARFLQLFILSFSLISLGC
jgi:hypothetical protein